jgi:5-formyltetrahydrofolate cyclo-ligase
MNKKMLREQMKNLRSQLTQKEIALSSQSIVKQIEKLEAFKKAKCIASFKAFSNEIDLSKLAHKKACFAYPKVEKDGIHFYKDDKNAKYKTSRFGIQEIENGENVDHQIDFMIVPALAIDHHLYRVGYGKGYYDRFLSQFRPKTVVGVIYTFQYVEKIDHTRDDQKLDDVIIDFMYNRIDKT